jgi:hypothetical protein
MRNAVIMYVLYHRASFMWYTCARKKGREHVLKCHDFTIKGRNFQCKSRLRTFIGVLGTICLGLHDMSPTKSGKIAHTTNNNFVALSRHASHTPSSGGGKSGRGQASSRKSTKEACAMLMRLF